MAVANDPRTLLEPDDSVKHNYLYDKIAPILGGTLGFGAASFMNYLLRKPIFSGKYQILFPVKFRLGSNISFCVYFQGISNFGPVIL